METWISESQPSARTKSQRAIALAESLVTTRPRWTGTDTEALTHLKSNPLAFEISGTLLSHFQYIARRKEMAFFP